MCPTPAVDTPSGAQLDVPAAPVPVAAAVVAAVASVDATCDSGTATVGGFFLNIPHAQPSSMSSKDSCKASKLGSQRARVATQLRCVDQRGMQLSGGFAAAFPNATVKC